MFYICTFVVLCSLATACKFYETDKANKLVDAANAAITDANGNMQKGNSQLIEIEQAIPNIDSDSGLEAQRAKAKDVISLLEKARDKYKEAGGKFEDASKLKVQDKFKDYLDTKGKEMKKRGDLVAALLEEPQAFLASSNREDYNAKVPAIVNKVKDLKKEADDLAAKADKIHDDNKDIFKSDS
jgi:hypothetical protein